MEENILNPDLLINKLLEEEEEFHHVNNPAADIKPVMKKYLGIPTHVEQSGNKFYFTDGDAKVEITVVNKEIIRVRLAPHGVFLDEFSYAVPKLANKDVDFTLTESETAFIVSTGTVNCHISKKDFLIAFTDESKHVTSVDAAPMHWEENLKFGGYYVFCTKTCSTNESFFGLGDKPTEFNLRGKRLKNWNTDAYSFAWNQDPLYRSMRISPTAYFSIILLKPSLILAPKIKPSQVFGPTAANCNTITSTART
jgi:alpha-glucosidase